MKKIQPATVNDPKAYAQCIRAGNLVFLSGQVALDVKGELVGAGDVAAQADFVWKQIGLLLEAAGAGYQNIVKITTFVTDISARPLLMGIRDRYLGEHRVTSTLVAVSALARPEFLIEIEATAVIE